MGKIIRLKYVLASLLLSLSFCLLKGQPLCIAQQYTVKDGLVQNNPSQILQDHNGFIWISTWNGLSRFDGREFATFKFDFFDNNHMQKIENTNDGNLWMISYDRKNLYLYDTHYNQIHNVLQTYEQKFSTPLQINELYALSKGVTWITLKSGGCFRIPDQEYNNPESIRHVHIIDNIEITDKIYKICQDNKGNEWILSNKGVALYNKQIISPYPFSMFENIDSFVFLASSSGRLACYNTDTNQFSVIPLSTASQTIKGIRKLEKGRLAILTNSSLYVYDLSKKTIREQTLSIPGYSVTHIQKIFQDLKGYIWAFTNAPGIIRLNIENGIQQYLNTPAKYAPSSPENELFIYEDPNQVIWTIPTQGAFSYYDEESKSLKYYFPPNENNKPYQPVIKSHYVDNKKNLWIKSQRSLIKMFFPKNRYSYQTLDPDFDTESLITDEKKNLWIATKKGNIHILNSDKQPLGYLSQKGRLTRDQNTFAASGIYALLMSKDKNIWIGSKEEGLYKLVPSSSPHQYEVFHYKHASNNPYSISSNNISCLYEDHNGRIWVGTFGGGLNLIEEKGNMVRFINSRNQLLHYPIQQTSHVRCIMETTNKHILVGTINGLVTFSSQFAEYENIHFYLNTYRHGNDGLSSSDIMSLLQSADGSIYTYCYGGGLCKLISTELQSNQLEFKSYSKNTSQLARAMTEDKSGNIWLCSETDITRFNVHSNTFEHFGQTFFNRSFNYSECLPIFNSQGDIFIGTEGGVLSFTPDEICKQIYEVPIVITGIQYPEDSLSHILNNATSLEIPTSQRNFTVSFAALDYTNSMDIEYAYTMNDNQWYYIGKKNSVSFVDLPAGEYNLKIKATNGEGIWMDTFKTANIHVLPTFWETTWAKVFYLLLFLMVSLIISYIFFYIYYLKHKVSMEQHLAEVKIRSFVDISHELRTPLTLISGPISEVLSQEPLTPRANKHLNLVQKNVNRMLLLINQVLDFQKIQNKKMRLTIEHKDIIEFLHTIMDNFQLLATKKNINFSLQTSQSSAWLWIDSDKFEKIIFNLLSNAFKYTPPNKSIIVTVNDTRKNVSIAIKDEGIGIQKDKIPHIFERFTTVSRENSMQPSSGIGLSLVNELVKIMHGEIRVESEIRKGSTFILTLQKGKEIYSKDENVEYVLHDIFEQDKKHTKQKEKETLTEDASLKEAPIKILVAEDNTELRLFICDILSKTYDVREAIDGVMALNEIAKDIPDFIITDIMMPNMDGVELIKQVKGNIQTCDLPIIVLSAKSSIEDRIAGLQLGIDDYIPKPFSAEYLRIRIDNLLTQRESLQKTILSRLNSQSENNKALIEQIAYPVSQIIPIDELFVQKLVEFMDANYSNPDLRVNELADYMNMSRSVFNRKINGIMGISPIEYIKRFRISKAKHFIVSGMSISEISFSVGFSDPNYFSKAFKKEVGLTPTEYKIQDEMNQNKTCNQK